MGVVFALVFANLGAAYGTAKAGVGIASMGVNRPELAMRSIIPVVMAGVLGIYGLIVAVIIAGQVAPPGKYDPQASPPTSGAKYSLFSGYAHFAAGISVGLSGLAAGFAIGVVGDAGVRAVGREEKLFVILVLVLIFAEALGLYGLIVSLILSQKTTSDICV